MNALIQMMFLICFNSLIVKSVHMCTVWCAFLSRFFLRCFLSLKSESREGVARVSGLRIVHSSQSLSLPVSNTHIRKNACIRNRLTYINRHVKEQR